MRFSLSLSVPIPPVAGRRPAALRLALALAAAAGLITALLVPGAVGVAADDAITPPSAASGTWLDVQAPASWNAPGADLPVAQPPSIPLDPRVVARERSPETPEEAALVDRGWRLFAAAQSGWGVRVVLATAGYDGMGRPWQYQAFVFVDGAFAGTLAPQPMDSRTDGALDSFMLAGADTVRATFRRYAAQDPLCCPTGASTVQYRVDRSGGQTLVVPVTADTRIPAAVAGEAVPQD